VRHDAFFTVLGALIVFIGFFVREKLRDKSRELSQALLTAENNQTIRKDLINIDLTLDMIAGQPMIGSAPAGRAPTLDEREDAAMHLMILQSEDFKSLNARFQIDEDLTEAVVKAGADRSVKDELLRKAEALKAASQKLWPRFVDIKRPNSATELNKSMKERDQAEDSITKFADQVLDFENRIAEELKRKKEQYDSWQDAAEYGVYGLFGIGWALGLIGKLLKVPALASSGE
jgi:hypothetical protein